MTRRRWATLLVLVAIVAATATAKAIWREPPRAPAPSPAPDPWAPIAVDEREPNDTRAACQKLPPTFPVVVRGRLSGDEDWYCLPAEVYLKSDVLVRLDAAACDATISVEDAAGRTIAETTRRLFPNAPIGAGEHALRLRAPACAGIAYELLVKPTMRPQPAREWEPNDTPEQASALPVESGVEGYVATAGDVDWYRVPLRAPSARARLRVEVKPPPGLPLTVEVREPRGGLLYRADGAAGERLVLRGLGVREWAEHYDVRIASPQTALEPYRVEAGLDSTDGAWEFEPNDAPATATPLPEALPVRGFLSTPGDVDHYRLSIRRPEAIVFRMQEAPAGLCVQGEVLDAGAKPLARGRFGAACGPDGAAELRATFARPGDYWLRLSAQPPSASSAEHGYVIAAHAEEPLKMYMHQQLKRLTPL